MKIVIAGVTGWVGRALYHRTIETPGIEIVGAVARRRAGEDLGTVMGLAEDGITISQTLAEALLVPSDVVIDYTSTEGTRAHAPEAIRSGRAVVIGSSGLEETDFEKLDRMAKHYGVGVVAAGNFSISATLLKRFAVEASRYLDDVEVIEYASAQRPDSPTGTGQEIAECLSQIRRSPTSVPLGELGGLALSRGAPLGSGKDAVQLHSVYLPSYTLAVETIHASTHERLVIRHEAGTSAQPYIAGTLLAARAALTMRGLVRGIESLV